MITQFPIFVDIIWQSDINRLPKNCGHHIFGGKNSKYRYHIFNQQRIGRLKYRTAPIDLIFLILLIKLVRVSFRVVRRRK